MNNTVLAGLIVGAVVVAAGSAIAVNSGFNPLQKYADVVSVEPAFETNRTPRQVCGEEAVLAAQAAASAQPPGAGPGAAAGATPPPAPPAAAPQPEAKPEGESEQAAAGEEGSAEDCVTVYDTKSVQAGFDVTYELDGVQKVVRMDHDPGERIPVEDGELVLSQS
jgi:uncharacterized protein YcfJ